MRSGTAATPSGWTLPIFRDMSKHGRVLVAMSGGVDSSVTAAMLHNQGYEVVGITMKTWDHATTGGKAEARARTKETGCCTLESMNDARDIAVRFGFTHFVVDIREEFGTWVIDRFERDYLAGRTPNPCVLCNTHIKWAALLKRADVLECDFIATGHYARVREDDSTGRFVLRRGVDRNKDQSYALWGVAQEHLARTRFPLGGFTKPEIRNMAAEMGLDKVASKPDSYEICFIPDGDYRDFLERRSPGLHKRLEGGAFVSEVTGEVLGRHRGYPFYTVGQRRGLDLAMGEPFYVTRIDAASNTVYVGERSHLEERSLIARELVFGKTTSFRDEKNVVAQVRYNDHGAPALVEQVDDDTVRVVFERPRAALAPGQAVVLYDGMDEVLAGGWMHRSGKSAEGEMYSQMPEIPLPVL